MQEIQISMQEIQKGAYLPTQYTSKLRKTTKKEEKCVLIDRQRKRERGKTEATSEVKMSGRKHKERIF